MRAYICVRLVVEYGLRPALVWRDPLELSAWHSVFECIDYVNVLNQVGEPCVKADIALALNPHYIPHRSNL